MTECSRDRCLIANMNGYDCETCKAVAEEIQENVEEMLDSCWPVHEKYDTSKVKTITLNGKKYIDMSAIEDIKTELPDHSFWQDPGGEPLVAIRDVIEMIDRKVEEHFKELKTCRKSEVLKEDFKEYAKKEFNQNVEFVKSDNPDTVESLFGPTEAPLSEAIRPVAFDDAGLEEAILDLDYIKELEEENEDLRQRLTNAANCLSSILQIVNDPTPIEASDYRRCCIILSNINKYAMSLKESKK